jgi:hypothetical protein
VQVEGDEHLLRRLGDMAEPNLGPCAGFLADPASERVPVSCRAVVDECDSRHDLTVLRPYGGVGILAVPWELACPNATPDAVGECLPRGRGSVNPERRGWA